MFFTRSSSQIVVQDLFSSLRLINYFTDEYYREENTLTIYTCVDEGDAQRNVITYQAESVLVFVCVCVSCHFFQLCFHPFSTAKREPLWRETNRCERHPSLRSIWECTSTAKLEGVAY